MGITVLGPLTVDGSGRLGPRDRVILQALATRPGRPVSADELTDALWGDQPPASSAKNLQSCVVRLRKALGADAIATTEHGYVLTLPSDQLDARDFETQVVRARELLAVGAFDRAAFILDRALELWRGPAFTELDEWEPARREAARLGELRLEAEELRVDALLELGRPREVLSTAQAMVQAAPLRERRWCLLASAQYAAGSQGEALRTMRRLRAVLADQLGADPGPEAEDLERAILQQDAALPGTTPRATSADCPWLGLRSYDVDDADQFFGREPDVAACLDLLARTSMTAIVGPSGSGKSSIMRAGVLAALRRRGHRLVVVTPGHQPMRSLTALAEDADADTVLAVDQAEEVFTLCEDPEDRRAFWDRLTREADRRPVVLSLRADRLGDVTEHPLLRLRVERGLHLVGSLDEEGLRQIVQGPARQAGLHVEPGLVDLLLREVGEDPGALPLLSHALVETWQRREGATLTVDGYLASGGIRGAVARSAERLYAGVGSEHRHLLRDVVLRLISPGPAGEPVRTRVPRRQLAPDPAHEELVEKLVAARLVTSDEGVLEITHEALARAWPRLRGWLDDDLEGQRILHHLSASAEAWDSLGRPHSELYRGVRLARATEWQAQTVSTLTPVERDFLDESRAAAERAEQDSARTARTQARLIRRLRIVLAGAVCLLVLALASGGVAILQSERATSNAAAATASERRALAGQAGAAALVNEDIGMSTRLALAGAEIDESLDTRTSLLGALARWPRLYASTPLEDGPLPMYLEASPDGRYLAMLDESYVVSLFDGQTGALVARRSVGPAAVKSGYRHGRLVAFSPDGRYLAVSGTPDRSRPVQLLSVPGLEVGPRLGGLPSRNWEALDIDFSDVSGHLAVAVMRIEGIGGASPASRFLVWDPGEPDEPVATVRQPGEDGIAVALDAAATTLYTSYPLRRHDLRTGRTSRVFDEDDHYVWRMHVLNDGRQLLALDSYAPTLFSLRTGEVIKRYSAGTFNNSLRLAPDERSFAVVDFGLRDVAIWSLDRRSAPPVTLSLDRGTPATVTFSSDGDHLIAAGQGERVLRQWDLTGDRQFLRRLPTSTRAAGGFGVLAAGGRYSVVLESGWGLSDYRTGRTRWVDDFGGYGHTYGAFHPTRPLFATARGRRITVFDIRTGRPTGTNAVLPAGELIAELDWTDDGSRLAVAMLSGLTSLHDGDSLEQVGPAVDVGSPLSWVVARPDGRSAVVLTGSVEPSNAWIVPGETWAVVDFEEGRVVRQGPLGMKFPTWLAVSPDGRTAVVTGSDDADATGNAGTVGTMQLIDVTTGDQIGPLRTWQGGARPQVSFSPDGSQLLTTSPGGLAVLWDVASPTPVARMQVPGTAVITGAFEPDGEAVRLLDWSSGDVVVWELDFDHAVDFACQVAGRSFTRDEWREHFGDEEYRQTCGS